MSGLTRRNLLRSSLAGVAAMAASSIAGTGPSRDRRLWLGGPVFEKYQDPQGWVGRGSAAWLLGCLLSG